MKPSPAKTKNARPAFGGMRIRTRTPIKIIPVEVAATVPEKRKIRQEPPGRSSIQYNPDDLLSAEEAASVMRLSSKTLANWRCSEKGPQYSKFGVVRYRYGDLLDFLTAAKEGDPNRRQGEEK